MDRGRAARAEREAVPRLERAHRDGGVPAERVRPHRRRTRARRRHRQQLRVPELRYRPDVWLEDYEPDALARIVEADRRGGGGIAQAYFHVILPLAPERDVRTLVRWGLREFEYRFGRRAEGIWLPETAVAARLVGA